MSARTVALEYLKLSKLYGPPMAYGNTTIDEAIAALEAEIAQEVEPVGWLCDGSLLYRLECGTNCDEINVTMAAGSRANEIRAFAAQALLKRITTPQAVNAWQPIETAPKYSDEIDIWSDGRRFTDCAFGKPTYGKELGWIYESHRDSDGPVYELVKNPTHWMPLPGAPA